MIFLKPFKHHCHQNVILAQNIKIYLLPCSLESSDLIRTIQTLRKGKKMQQYNYYI